MKKELLHKRKLRVGDKAPDFILLDQNNQKVHLREIIGKNGLILFFYPKDNTRGCTIQVCMFRDKYDLFLDKGFNVVGISSDSVSSHVDFSSRNNIPFQLLSDINKTVRKLYQAESLLGLIPKRVTYIIDKKFIIRDIFSSQFNISDHIERTSSTVNLIHMI